MAVRRSEFAYTPAVKTYLASFTLLWFATKHVNDPLVGN